MATQGYNGAAHRGVHGKRRGQAASEQPEWLSGVVVEPDPQEIAGEGQVVVRYVLGDGNFCRGVFTTIDEASIKPQSAAAIATVQVSPRY